MVKDTIASIHEMALLAIAAIGTLRDLTFQLEQELRDEEVID